MLIIMKDRDGHLFFQLLFDIKTLGRLDILQVNAAEGRLQQLDRADEFIRIGGVDFQIKDIDIGKAFKQNRLSLHHRLAGQGADGPQTEHCRTVGNDGDQIGPIGVLKGLLRILFDLQTGDGYPGRIGQAEIRLGDERLGGNHLGLPRSRFPVISECFFFVVNHFSFSNPA